MSPLSLPTLPLSCSRETVEDGGNNINLVVICSAPSHQRFLFHAKYIQSLFSEATLLTCKANKAFSCQRFYPHGETPSSTVSGSVCRCGGKQQQQLHPADEDKLVNPLFRLHTALKSGSGPVSPHLYMQGMGAGGQSERCRIRLD